MKTEVLENELRLNGLNVFTVKDVARLTGKPINYVYLLLSKSKRFVRVQNGLYSLSNTDPLEIASRILSPSYISLISAFNYYELIDQVPKVIKVITNRRHAAIENIMGLRIEFKSVKSSMFYGYFRQHNISIAEIEKAVVDSSYLLEDMQYLDEVIENLKDNRKLNINKLLDYAERCGVNSVYVRVKRLVE